ncbi:molybdopterin cofactor-binding domain-containing protein [Melioribacteraceae bacterium 4301-Me]|uniref:xanthine dehydrogenase family protein molybdopterin-binding subunit n=1 Tax=Pyranulibacter aquaticus TaxID=3163344 RepID=UPI00359A0B7D
MKKRTRREFIKVFSLSSTSLFLVSYLPADNWLAKLDGEPKIFSPSVYLKIDSNGIVTIIVHRSEMGQGVRTSLPMLLAEELEVDWEKIRIEQAEGDKKYGNQVTGGSTSIRRSWEPFRIAGATAREMLITAAAARWKVKSSDCKAENGYVINKINNKKISYGDLVEDASKLPVPKNVKLKDPKDFKIIGKRLHRLDTPAKVYGKAKYGIDIVLPGMLYAAVSRSPVFGAKVKSFDASKVKSINGIFDVKEISSGIAVVADSTWHAFKGKNALSVIWDEGPNVNVDSESIRNRLKEKLKVDGELVESKGDIDLLTDEGAKKIEAVYEVPFEAHATMEPMNCVAKVENNKAEIWAPTQSPQQARTAVAEKLGLDEDNVTVYVTLMGGGFGRRSHTDFVIEAAEISKAVNKPVKVIWTREDDIKHDRYRPVSMHHLKGIINKRNKLLFFSHHVIAPSIWEQNSGVKLSPKRYDTVGGAVEHDYEIPNYKITGSIVEVPIPIWYWRAVYHSQNPFAAESFIDELAYAAGKDPYLFRMEMLPDNSRLKNVLKVAAEKSGWGKKLPKGKGMGLAVFSGYDSYCAEVTEVTVNENNEIKVDKVTCAIDCGIVVNPDIVEQQVDSAIAFSLSAALKGQITIRNGSVVESNFDDFPILTFSEMPIVETHIMQNTFSVGGVGEVAVGACAPSLANAIFAATGKRIRKLPISL